MNEIMKRGFMVVNEEWTAPYLSHEVEEIMFGVYTEYGGGTEMAMRWYSLDGEVVPRLEVYDGSWNLLISFNDVIAELGKVDTKNISQKEFCEILKSLGFEDMTRREKPV